MSLTTQRFQHAVLFDWVARSQTRRLVRALEIAFRIDPQDDRLVAAFGQGDESSNHQALFHWVYREVHRLDEEAARALLPHLTHRLTVCLQDWEIEQCL